MTLDARGLRGEVLTPSGKTFLDAPYVGEHNLANVLLTLGIVSALGLSVEAATAALHTSAPVPGRFERCDGDADDVVVLVDYAHTPDALDRALRALRPLTQGRILCVFGCGGDRDRLKRPQMGAIAARGADVAVLTNDNPRSESPQAIANAVLSGIPEGTAEVVVELDRARAIAFVMERARPGDVVLIAGKGHETYQIIGEHTKHFDDRQEARAALAARRRVSNPEG
jgi:UDP-N-acetylmuramoyl-L-alanyl-D-glutamate--2,6-diaminopimelate ligase